MENAVFHDNLDIKHFDISSEKNTLKCILI